MLDDMLRLQVLIHIAECFFDRHKQLLFGNRRWFILWFKKQTFRFTCGDILIYCLICILRFLEIESWEWPMLDLCLCRLEQLVSSRVVLVSINNVTLFIILLNKTSTPTDATLQSEQISSKQTINPALVRTNYGVWYVTLRRIIRFVAALIPWQWYKRNVYLHKIFSHFPGGLAADEGSRDR